MENDLQKDPVEFYKHLSLFWTDLIYLMSSKPQALTSVGPMRNFATNAKKIATELLEANDDLVEFNTRLTEYYQQLADTWTEAQKKVTTKIPKVPNDQEQFEAYKRIWIDMFDNDFTELFDSKKFGDNYGKLVASELELSKHWEQIVNVMLQSANLPNKKEIDEVYKELHSLRKRVSKLESQTKTIKPRSKTNDSGE
ncbi:MAG TPA: poly(R)-hydroxyalkanoic acid synthase subunit PhaE [Nitrosopumilaceae archaeon]